MMLGELESVCLLRVSAGRLLDDVIGVNEVSLESICRGTYRSHLLEADWSPLPHSQMTLTHFRYRLSRRGRSLPFMSKRENEEQTLITSCVYFMFEEHITHVRLWRDRNMLQVL